jgi:hypothetical protein
MRECEKRNHEAIFQPNDKNAPQMHATDSCQLEIRVLILTLRYQ